MRVSARDSCSMSEQHQQCSQQGVGSAVGVTSGGASAPRPGRSSIRRLLPYLESYGEYTRLSGLRPARRSAGDLVRSSRSRPPEPSRARASPDQVQTRGVAASRESEKVERHRGQADERSQSQISLTLYGTLPFIYPALFALIDIAHIMQDRSRVGTRGSRAAVRSTRPAARWSWHPPRSTR